MPKAPEQCIVCGGEGVQEVWNGLDILQCPSCSLAWRRHFDLPDNYYNDLNLERLDLDNDKSASRLSNSWSRLRAIRQFLPPGGICDVGCGEGFFLEALEEDG